MKRNIFIGSLVTVAAVGTIGVNVAQASYAGMRSVKNNSASSELPAYRNHAHATVTVSDECIADIGEMSSLPAKFKKMQRISIKNALDKHNWHAYWDAVRGTGVEKIVDTPEKFAWIIEARELYRQGRREEARDIVREMRIYDRKMWRAIA